MTPPTTSAIIATCYVALVAVLACVQFHRSRTPLRLGSAVMAVFGLSISALSVLYVIDKVSLSAYLVYQFVAEALAVTWLVMTIIQLGYAFYPVTRHQTLIWRTALGSVILYDLVAIAEISFYCYEVWGSHHYTTSTAPVLWIYWLRQVVKIQACAVTIAYLFVPLVRHHNSTGVANIADSNTLAVGTWYLSALGLTSLGYACMSIYYMTKPGDVFLIQAQAIDLCIRITSCPILSLPPPKFLLDYFHAKYGSTAANDNPNTMIEEGITNDPRPRRPPMLVNQNSSFISRRNSDFMFDGPMYHGRDSFSTHSPYVLREPGDERCMRYPDEDHGLASTSSSSDTAAEKSPRLNPKSSQPSLLQKETLVPALASGGTSESSVTSLAVSWPCNPSGMDKGKVSLSFAEGESLTLSLDNPGYVALTPPPPAKRNMEEETAWAARRISRRLTMEGRRDGPDFMNLSSLVRWPHRSVVAPPSTTHPSKSGSLFPSNLFISSHHGSQYESPALQLSSSLPSTLEHGGPLIRETLISTTPRQDESGGITDNPIPAIGKRSSEDNNYHEDGHSYRGFSRIRTRGKGGPLRDDTQLEESHDSEEAPLNAYENHQSPAGGASSGHILDTESATITAATKETAAMAPDQTNPSRRGSLSKQLSMDSIRKMSRGALTRLQEGGLGAALSIPASTGPLSPTLLRTNGSPLDAKSPTKPLALSSISKPAFLPLHPIESTESPGQGSNVAEGRNDLNKN